MYTCYRNGHTVSLMVSLLILVPDKCPLVDRFIRYDNDVCVLTELPGLPDRYLLPPHSSFLISDFSKLQPLIEAGKYMY